MDLFLINFAELSPAPSTVFFSRSFFWTRSLSRLCPGFLALPSIQIFLASWLPDSNLSIYHARDTIQGGCLLRSGRDRGARGTLGDGLLSLRELPALFRRAGERVHVVEMGEREASRKRRGVPRANSRAANISDRRYCTKCGSHISVDHPTLGLIDVRIGALRNFPFKPKVHLNYAEDHCFR